MLYSFDKKYTHLTKTLPLFPLSRVLLLPRAKLPLNLFENRYLHMFDHALANGRLIGMIQPNKQLKLKNSNNKQPRLYQIGCAGYITAFSQTNDNRYEIILKGLCRFKVSSELSVTNGFRRADVCWKSFKKDFEKEVLSDKSRRVYFLSVLKQYLKKMSINADWEAIEVSNDEDLVNSISMGCPFDENEKQALLEAINLDKRIEILTSLMNMSVNENTMTKSGTALS
tara:strand:- start:89 stop:769 length:681 start_codon:yes stop_codon:yes gene_type:complete